MTGQSHYQVLGVSPDADVQHIRAAYVSLLKRFHPDQGKPGEAENGIYVQRIVRAYRILKDPETRAEYDAALKPPLPQTRILKLRPPRARKILRSRKRWKLDKEVIFYSVTLVSAAFGLQLLVSRLIERPGSHSTTLGEKLQGRNPAAVVQFESFVRKAGMMPASEASVYSARCFAAAQRSRSPVAADPCVGFDMAYVYWRETAGGPLVLEPYFQPDAIKSRADEAYKRLNPIAAAARIQSLRAVTFRTIIRTSSATNEFALGFPASQAESEASPPKQTPPKIPAEQN